MRHPCSTEDTPCDHNRVRSLRVLLAGLLGALLWPSGSTAAAAPDDGFGSANVTRAAYDWLGPDVPNDAYAITLVRGRSVPSVLRLLAPRRELGARTPGEAYEHYLDRLDQQTE